MKLLSKNQKRLFNLQVIIAMITISGLISFPLILTGQSFSHPSTGMVVNGDIMDAASGIDFIAVVYARSGEVFYNQLEENGIWTGEELLGTGSEARLAIGHTGQPHVVFTSAGKIAYRTFNESAWSEIVYIESNNAGACSKPDIALDGNNYAHITYTDTKGNVGNYTDRPDIMYAVNTNGDFVKSLIFNGYYDFYGGADAYAEYFDKGSLITVDTEGNYYIMSHKYQFTKWMSGNDKQYSIIVNSNLGTGGTSVSSSDVFTIHDLDYIGSAVFALYKQSTFKIAELSLSGTTISFINTTDIVATSVSSLSMNGTDAVVGGISSSKLFTKFNDLGHIYENITVKGSTVSTAAVAGVYYSIYTDNGDGMIKIHEVAEPLSFTRFWFTQQTGPAFIDGHAGTVAVEVENGTDLTSLTASYTTTSDVTGVELETIAQTSGVSINDFSLPLTYELKDGVTVRSWIVTVTEEPSIYTVSATSSPAEGGSISGTGDYTEGSTVTLSASASADYSFLHWTENGAIVSTDAEYSFVSAANRSLEAVFIEQFTLTIQIEGIGSIKVDDVDYTGVVTVSSGTILSLEAIAGDEYHFTNWSGDLASQDNPESLTMDGDKVIQATFSINQYTLTIQTTGSGSVKVDDEAYTNVITVNSGTLLSLEAIAGDEYHFTGWSGDLASSDNPVSVTMDADKIIHTTFSINQYTLTIQTTGSGLVEVEDAVYTEVISVNTGTILNLKAIAEGGYEFSGWTGDLISTGNPASVTMDRDMIITASFSLVSGMNNLQPKAVGVYPNPFADELNLRHEGNAYRIVIVNIAGQPVLDIHPNGSQSIHTGKLKSGVYFITIELNNGERLTGKIIKE